jgi:hypothetical protein
MDEKIYIQCPECEMPINFSEEVRRVHETLGDIVLQGKALSTFYVTCDFCAKRTVKVTIEPVETEKEEEPEPPERLLN